MKSKFFDCFENNDFDDFVAMSYESIAKQVFKKETVFDPASHLIDEFYWAGLIYMDLLFNYSVPLKRSMIIFPLKEMVDLYYPYHEADFSKAAKFYLKIEQERSVLEILRKERNIQLSKLAFITGINEKSLRIFASSNAALFATSLSSLVKLANFFEVDISVFKTKSSCLPYAEIFFKMDEFRDAFVNNLLFFLGIKKKERILYQYVELENKEMRKALHNYDLIVMLSEPFGVIKSSNNLVIQKYLNQTEFMFLYAKTADEYRERSKYALI